MRWADVGCTFRVVSRQRVVILLPELALDGSAFGLEMLTAAALQRARIVQVPVNYRRRVAVSSVAGEQSMTVPLGLEMLAMVLRMWMGAWPPRRAG